MKNVLILFVIFLAGCNAKYSIPKGTVMITNLAENSGGSGSIVRSNLTHSEVLTNSHVCEVVKKGGKVHSHLGTHFVTSYKQSKIHDLCLITVSEDLDSEITLAQRSPDLYEEATVAGHPLLMPTLIGKGSFSPKQIITIMVGVRACTKDDLEDPGSAIFCLFIGGIPILKNYEATLLSVLIQPGSSGSAVYNSRSELSGVVFAGQQPISYGYAVPYEYVYNFLITESKELEDEFPVHTSDVNLSFAKKTSEQVKKACEKIEEKDLRSDICTNLNKIIIDDSIF